MTEANEQIGHMRQGNEVAAGADGTFTGNFGKDVFIEGGQDEFDQFFTDARVAARERIGAGQHNRASFGDAEKGTLADREMVKQVELVLAEFLRANSKTAERAKAGI